MKRAAVPLPDAAVRVAAWIAVAPVALVAVAPQWLELPGGAFDALALHLAYLALGVGAVLWSAAALRTDLAIVVEDAFGRRSELANAASGATATTYALLGLAFVFLAAPKRVDAFEPALVTLATGVGRVLLVLGAGFLAIAVRSVRRRNRREADRRMAANVRAAVGRGLSEALASPPPRHGGTSATW